MSERAICATGRDSVLALCVEREELGLEVDKVVSKSVHEAKPECAGVITVYTDGSCLGNPGRGGYCALIVQPSGALTPIVGSAKETTNNQMELMAAIVALEQVQDCEPTELRIFSDSIHR